MTTATSGGREGRETIFARIREAAKAAGVHPEASMPPGEGRPGLPEDFPDRGSRTAALGRRMEELRISFVLCDNADDVSEGVRMLVQRSEWKQFASQGGERLTALLGPLDGKVVRVDTENDKAKLAACEAGIVECLAIDAQTGAILIASPAGSLELTSAVTTLVIIAAASRIAGSLDEAFRMVKNANNGTLPPGLSILTGPSQNTAIERRPMTKGHGPLSLVVYLSMGE